MTNWLTCSNLIIFGARYLPLLLVGSLLILWLRGKHVLVFKALVAMAIGIAVSEFLKSVFKTPRPFVAEAVTALINVTADGAFPSSHTTGLVALAISLIREARLQSVILFAGALLVGFCRVLAYVHYPRDILGGIVLGTAVGIGITLARNYFSSKE